MPKYVFTSPEPMVFGDLHYGENAEVEGVSDRDGQAVVLFEGDVITTKDSIEHAFLKPSGKTAPAVEPVVDAPVADAPVADSPKPKPAN
jgi:hypothetical protein